MMCGPGTGANARERSRPSVVSEHGSVGDSVCGDEGCGGGRNAAAVSLFSTVRIRERPVGKPWRGELPARTESSFGRLWRTWGSPRDRRPAAPFLAGAHASPAGG